MLSERASSTKVNSFYFLWILESLFFIEILPFKRPEQNLKEDFMFSTNKEVK